MNKDKKLNFLKFLLVFLIGWQFFLPVVKNKQIFLKQFDVEYWRERYQRSQWAKGFEAEELMGDAELYAWAGWFQVKGGNPAEVNPEQGPVGKYLIGLSILLFDNPVVVSVILGLGVLIVTFLLAREIFGSDLLAVLPVFLLSFDRLFKENLLTSMLDLPFSFFVGLFFYFLLKAETRKIFYLPAVAFLGLATGTKVYLAGLGLLGAVSALMVFMLITSRKDYLYFFLFLPFAGLTYLGFYGVFFAQGNNLWDFKYLHFWIRHFARVRVENYPQAEIFKILILGRWLTWWDGFERVKIKQWSILWPISFLVSIWASLRGLIEKNYSLLLLGVWVVSFLIMYSFGVPYPRYLLPILPALYIMLVWGSAQFIARLQKMLKLTSFWPA